MARNITDFSGLEKNKEVELYRKNIKILYIFLGIATIFFYFIPFITGYAYGANSDLWKKVIIPMLLVNINTLYIFLACFIHSSKCGFKAMTPIALAVFYVPSTFIFYGPQMAAFAIIYLVIGLFGELAGRLFMLRSKSKKAPIGLNRNVKPASKGKKK